MNIIINDNVGVSVTPKVLSSGEIEFMIDERVSQSEANGAAQVPTIIAGQLRDTNSTVSSALLRTTSSRPVRP